MKILEGSAACVETAGEGAGEENAQPALPRGCLLTIGVFDGLHLGHQALLNALQDRGHETGSETALYTFHPHPRRVLAPADPFLCLQTQPQFERVLASYGIDYMIREPFTPDFAALSAEEFLTEVIQNRLAPREIFVGRDFHFGKGARGSGETLAHVGPSVGIRVTIIPQIRTGELDVSSTRIRASIASGELEDATLCLGRPYEITGKVVMGDQRGRTLGFPTANLAPDSELLPHLGVYATQIRRLDSSDPERLYPAVTNVGTRPTFNKGQVLAESHLFDFDEDLYGERIDVVLRRRIRQERHFSGPDELAGQIRQDAEEARQILAQLGD